MKKISSFELFISFFKTNMITFGGGYAIMPIIKKVYVDDKKILVEDDMLDLIALAQSIPGAMAINTSMLVGYKLRGTLGALVSLVGAFLPPLLIISIISVFYQIFQTNPIIQAILGGMRGAVSAVMIFAAYNMFTSLLKTNRMFSLTLMSIAFVLAWFTSISVGYIMLSAGIIGFLYFGYIKERLSL